LSLRQYPSGGPSRSSRMADGGRIGRLFVATIMERRCAERCCQDRFT
jgi:hypothetical protein